MAATYLTKTFASGGSITKWTYSVWLKRSKISYNTANIFGRYQSADYFTGLYFSSDDGLQFLQKYGGSNDGRLMTSDKYRDTSGWMHIVAVWDSANSTADDRMKLYVNGVSPTIINRVNATQNRGSTWNTSNPDNDIGRANGMDGDTNYFDGLMSHIHFCDGYAYSASDFGETDATTGEWKLKTSPSVSYGTTGFNILKNGNSVTDTSPNSNNFTVGGGTLTKTEDNPSNVFVTLNKLQKPYASQSNTLNFGNTQYADNNSNWQRNYGTIGATTGKYFYEFKCLNDDGNSGRCRIGWDSIDDINASNDNYYSGLTLDRAGILRGGEKGYDGYSPNNVQMSAAHSGGNFSFTANDILGMAIDIDNNTFSVYKNGNLEINAYSYASASNCSLLKSKGHFIAPSVNWYSTSGDVNSGAFNFGNGYFGTTAVSSAGTNASNNGIFEYDVPTGYTALSTKGLNT